MEDAGAELIVIPRDPIDLINAPAANLHAANGADVHTCENRSLTVDLGPNHTLRWLFIVADVPYSIIGIGILQQFDLLVNARYGEVVDRPTSLTVTGSFAAVKQIMPEYAKARA